jgi:hypothetical protein
VNASVVGVADSVTLPPPDEVTAIVTSSVWVPADDASEIVPLQILPAAIPEGSTDTVKLVLAGPAVNVPDGESASHVLLVQLTSEACAVALMLLCAVTVNVCGVGAAAPGIALNVRLEGLTVKGPVDPMVPFEVTFSVMGTIREPLAATITIVPPHVVLPVIPDGSTDTVKFVLVTPATKGPAGERLSQLLLAQLCFDICAVAFVSNCAETVKVCEAGAAAPATTLNVSAVGLTTRAAACTPITLRTIGTLCVTEPALMEIVPLQLVPIDIPE